MKRYMKEFGTILLAGCALFGLIGFWVTLTFGPIICVCVLADAYEVHALIAMPMIILAYFLVFVFLRHFKLIDDLGF